MTELVLCFDRARPDAEPGTSTNAHRLFHLLGGDDDRLTWYHSGVSTAGSWTRWNPLRWRTAAIADARAAIAEAYRFLVDRWEPDDPVYMFGVGRGGSCAVTLTRLLAAVGLLPDLADYVVSVYALPRTERSLQDWQRVTQVASELAQQRRIGLPVHYLGLWDTLPIAGATRCTMPDPLPTLESGRHAVAIDGCLISSASDRIEEVLFRGAHRDVTFGWVLDGAVKAGLSLPGQARDIAPAPSHFEALAEVDSVVAEAVHDLNPATE